MMAMMTEAAATITILTGHDDEDEDAMTPLGLMIRLMRRGYRVEGG